LTSILKVDNLQDASGTGSPYIKDAVLKVYFVEKTDTQSTTGITFEDITDLSLTITPLSNKSKFLVRANLFLSGNTNFAYARLVRDSTQISLPDGHASFNRSTAHFGFGSNDASSFNFAMASAEKLDNPQTSSAITYKVQFSARADTGTAYINRTSRNNDNANGFDQRGTSSLTIMEIGG